MSLKKVKKNFLHLTEQYSNLGELFYGVVEGAISSVMVLEQYQQMGEQLKALGEGLNDLGGDPVMGPPVGRRPSVN